jgi:hypothetical protein
MSAINAFSSLTATLSSLNHNYHLDGVVFLNSNESGITETRDYLKKAKMAENGIHLGVSSLHNFDIIEQTRPKFAILIDHGAKVVDFNKQVINILRNANSRKEFHTMLTQLVPNDLREEDKTMRWAESDDGFFYLKKMAEEERIYPLCLKIDDCESIKKIAQSAHKAGLVFSSLYVSNIYDYYEGDHLFLQKFQKSIGHLATDGTVIIDATFHGQDPNSIVQHASYAKGYDPSIIRTHQESREA